MVFASNHRLFSTANDFTIIRNFSVKTLANKACKMSKISIDKICYKGTNDSMNWKCIEYQLKTLKLDAI